MSEKSNKRNSFSKFFGRVFRGRSSSLPEPQSAKKAKEKKENKKTKNKDTTDEDVFGIEETAKLQHFQKPKPPANRRRPKSVARSISSSPMTSPPPAVMSLITEEDENENLEQIINIVEPKVKSKEVPRLFTPALPSSSLQEKLLSKTTKTVDMSPIDTLDLSTNDVEDKSELEASNSPSENENSFVGDSNKLSRSLSNKIDFQQLRLRSKNLRLVKSLEVDQKSPNQIENEKNRASDPGRQ